MFSTVILPFASPSRIAGVCLFLPTSTKRILAEIDLNRADLYRNTFSELVWSFGQKNHPTRLYPIGGQMLRRFQHVKRSARLVLPCLRDFLHALQVAYHFFFFTYFSFFFRWPGGYFFLCLSKCVYGLSESNSIVTWSPNRTRKLWGNEADILHLSPCR